MGFAPGEIIEMKSPIEMHMHSRDPDPRFEDDIESTTEAAVHGGYMGAVAMPNTEPWADRLEVINQQYATARRAAHTHFGAYAGARIGNFDPDQLMRMYPHVAGLKIYWGRTQGEDDDHDLEAGRDIIDTWAEAARRHSENTGTESNKVIVNHALDEFGEDVMGYIVRHLGLKGHLAHMHSEFEVNFMAQLIRDFPELASGEVSTHHLTSTANDADRKYGWMARMKPPLRREADQEALLYGLNKEILPGVYNIAAIANDNAPHPTENKMRAETTNPKGEDFDAEGNACDACYGISGIEFALPVLTRLVANGDTTMERLEHALHDEPARILGLSPEQTNSTTTLEIGPVELTADMAKSRTVNYPYVGWMGWAKVVDVEIDGVSRLRSDNYFEPKILMEAA